MRVIRPLIVLLAIGALVGACSSSGDSSGDASDAVTTLAPEDVKAPAAAVTKGLNEIKGFADEVAATAGTDKAAAQAASDKIEPVWMTIEGTVKSNDEEIYLTFEDSFTTLANAADSGDAASAKTAAADVTNAVQDYLAKYPG